MLRPAVFVAVLAASRFHCMFCPRLSWKQSVILTVLCPAVFVAVLLLLQKDIILHDNDADIVVLNPDWDVLLAQLKAALPQFRVFFVVPSEDRNIRWIRLLSGVGIMDLVSRGG